MVFHSQLARLTSTLLKNPRNSSVDHLAGPRLMRIYRPPYGLPPHCQPLIYPLEEVQCSHSTDLAVFVPITIQIHQAQLWQQKELKKGQPKTLAPEDTKCENKYGGASCKERSLRSIVCRAGIAGEAARRSSNGIHKGTDVAQELVPVTWHKILVPDRSDASP